MNPGDDNDGPDKPHPLAALSSLAPLAFGRDQDAKPATGRATRSLAFLSREALELDLSDPEQRHFGDYELLECLGAGGTGVVYRARQKSLDREVAIKLLSAGPWASPDFIGRFQREAQSAARLQHPNIVAIYEIGSCDELNYFSMALVHGPNLAQLLAERGAMPARQVARLVQTIAEALHYAHRLGVLHLDLKPGNVLTTEDGEPQVADFGLARRIDDSLMPDGDEVSGTPSYMAPEQIEMHRHQLGVATDIYGLGTILYELLSGQPPFNADTPKQTLDLVLHGRLRHLDRYRNDIPPDLEAICRKCLCKEPRHRYPDAQLLADDLGRFLDDRPVSVHPLNRRQRIARWAHREPKLALTIAFACVAVLVGLVTSAWQWQRAESGASSARYHLWEQRHETALRLFEEQRGYGALPLLAANLHEQQASGEQRAVARERLRLRVAQMQMPALLNAISVGAAVHVLALSPDGRYLALGLQPNTVALYEVATLRQRWRVRLSPHDSEGDGQLRRLVFTPDMRYLLVSEHWRMAQIRPGGFQTYRLSMADGAQTRVPGADAILSESWSDDGRHVVLTDKNHSWFRLYAADSWKLLAPTMHSNLLGARPGWLIAPGLKFIAMDHGSEGVGILDPRTLQPRYSLRPDRPDTRFIAWAISPDARWLALGRTDGEILLVDADSGAQRPLFPPTGGQVKWLSFSADSRHLAATKGSEFYVFSIPDGTGMYYVARDAELWGHQLDCDAGSDNCGALLMEWDRVTLWSFSGGVDLSNGRVMDSPEITHHSYVPRFASSFSRSHRLLVTGAQDGSLRLWRLPPSPVLGPLAPTQRETPLYFDGQHLVAVEGREVWVFDARDGQPRSPRMILPQPAGFAALSPDGRTLVASSGPALHVFDWRSGKPRYPPIQLGGSPMDLWLTSDGRSVVARWAAPQRMPIDQQRLQAYDLGTGRALGPPGDMLVGSARISADNRQLLVSQDAATTLFALTDLTRPLRRFPVLDDESVVVFGAEDPADNELVQFVENYGADIGNTLRRWSLADGRLLRTLPLNVRIEDLQVRASDGRAAISGSPGGTAMTDVAVLIDRDGARVPITLTRHDGLARAQAFSADGHLLAQALGQGVMLVDADTGVPLGPPLRTSLPIPDNIAQLAFSPDARQLLARTTLGRWLRWSLRPEPRSAALMSEEAALLAPVPSEVFKPPSAALRASLRQRDRATPPAPRPPPSVWSCLPRHDAIPPRLADTPPWLIDLSSDYTASLHEIRSSKSTPHSEVGNLCALPPGVQRLQGVDYDLRGVVDLRFPEAGEAKSDPDRHHRTRRIEVAPGRYTTAHVLGASTATTSSIDNQPVARLSFHYRDGGVASVPFRTANWNTGNWQGWRDWRELSLAWKGFLPEVEVEVAYSAGIQLYSTRVDNPDPGREVVAIDVQSTMPMYDDRGLAVVAITLDPAAPVTVAGKQRP